MFRGTNLASATVTVCGGLLVSLGSAARVDTDVDLGVGLGTDSTRLGALPHALSQLTSRDRINSLGLGFTLERSFIKLWVLLTIHRSTMEGSKKTGVGAMIGRSQVLPFKSRFYVLKHHAVAITEIKHRHGTPFAHFVI
jgi:hypothetical protein